MDLKQAVVQDSRDNKVLRVGYVNGEALSKMEPKLSWTSIRFPRLCRHYRQMPSGQSPPRRELHMARCT